MADMSVKDGRLVLPDGMSYRVLVLPERETMTPALLRKIKELVEAGRDGHRPAAAQIAGSRRIPGCDAEVKTLADEIWGDCDGDAGDRACLRQGPRHLGAMPATWPATAKARLEAAPSERQRKRRKHDEGRSDSARTGRGTSERRRSPSPSSTAISPSSPSVLTGLGVPPDFESEADLRYTHRRTARTEIYFVANPEDRALAADCVFRVTGKQPELWDAVTGEIRDLPEFAECGGRTSVPLRFEPHQSFFVVFRKRGDRSRRKTDGPDITSLT